MITFMKPCLFILIIFDMNNVYFAAPVSVVMKRIAGVRRTATISALAAVIGMIITGFNTQPWHTILTFCILTCKFVYKNIK